VLCLRLVEGKTAHWRAGRQTSIADSGESDVPRPPSAGEKMFTTCAPLTRPPPGPREAPARRIPPFLRRCDWFQGLPTSARQAEVTHATCPARHRRWQRPRLLLRTDLRTYLHPTLRNRSARRMPRAACSTRKSTPKAASSVKRKEKLSYSG